MLEYNALLYQLAHLMQNQIYTHFYSTEFDQIHVDITDGHFTNNISMSFSHIKEVKNQTDYKVDVQLMVEDNNGCLDSSTVTFSTNFSQDFA